MKKYSFILMVSAVLALTSCGSKSTTTETSDSTAVSVDSSAVTVDSTTVETTVGGGSSLESQPIK